MITTPMITLLMTMTIITLQHLHIQHLHLNPQYPHHHTKHPLITQEYTITHYNYYLTENWEKSVIKKIGKVSYQFSIIW